MKPPQRESPLRIPRAAWFAGGVFLIATAVLAWARVGLLDLPPAPRGVTLEAAGLADLERMRRLNAHLWADARSTEEGFFGDAYHPPESMVDAIRRVRDGRLAVEAGGVERGLELMREGIRLQPRDLVLGNAYRMVLFKLRRGFHSEAKQRGSLTPAFPPHLFGQPISFFEELARAQPTAAEPKLQLALAWVDEMLLFPALEIKAPASVEAVNILTSLIENGNAAYVPALFARGLNHLHRPARLVWPESRRTAPDAAVQDIARCVAIGRKLGTGSDRLQATLAMTLGDAYIKAGRYSVARSWWQITQNLCHDDDIQQAVRRRYSWPDEEVLDRLEDELDRARGELDHPMTDLALMWN